MLNPKLAIIALDIRKIFSVILFTLCLASFTSGYGQKTYQLDSREPTHRLDPFVEIFIDSGGTYSFDEVSTPEFQSRFVPNPKNGLTFGYLRPPIWLKINIQNDSPANWFLEIPAPFLEGVECYQQRDGLLLQQYKTGYYLPHHSRGFPHTGYAFALNFSKAETTTVFIRITGLSPKTFPLFVVEKESFLERIRFEDFGYGIFFGILLVMLFYNLFLYFTLKHLDYFLYSCTIVCTIAIFAAATGYGGKFLWPNHPYLNFYAGRLSLPVQVAILAFFTLRFLETKKYSRIAYYTLLTLIPLAVIAMMLMLTGTLPSAGNNLLSIALVIFLLSGVVCRINGNKTANFYIAAWSLYLFGGLMLTLRNSGFFDFNFWTTHLVEIGAAAETTIIALALGARYRRYKEEKEEVQLLALKLQQETNELLEIKVKERTEQLSKANEELSATLETNKLQTEVIEKKNAELDDFFYRISHDLRGPISSLLAMSFLADKEVADPKAREYLDRQKEQAERLNGIINALINLTKLSHNEFRSEPIDFSKMVDECIESFNSHVKFKKITFRKNIQQDLQFESGWVFVNAILQNLIENGIKYSGEKEPFVQIDIHSESGGITIEVSDNGQGIPANLQPKIFDMFFRASQSGGGSGLGLYILKRSVDKLNGKVDLQSELGKGTTFTIKLPKGN